MYIIVLVGRAFREASPKGAARQICCLAGFTSTLQLLLMRLNPEGIDTAFDDLLVIFKFFPPSTKGD